jgi:hypothetical protein
MILNKIVELSTVHRQTEEDGKLSGGANCYVVL